MSFYTDGDWGFEDFDELKSHKSQYFDQEFYEYTKHDDDSYTYKLKRVFNCDTPTNIIAAQSFIQHTLIDSIYGRVGYADRVKDFLNDALIDLSSNVLKKEHYSYYDYIDSNTEGRICMRTTFDFPPKIKQIIYEDNNIFDDVIDEEKGE